MHPKKVVFILLLLASFTTSKAQSGSDKVFQNYGYYFGLNQMPAFDLDIDGFDLYSQYRSYKLGITYRIRYNLYALSDHTSVSASFMPAIGIDGGTFSGSDVSGFGGLHLPLLLSLNTGAGSTYDTDKNVGFGFSFGLEYSMTPLAILDSEVDGLNKSYTNPFIQLGIRYWKSRSNTLREFFIRYKFMSNPDEASSSTGSGGIFGSDEDIRKPYSITIGWVKFLNY